MDIRITTEELSQISAELAVVGIFEDHPSASREHIPEAYRGAVADAQSRGEFEGKLLQSLSLLPGSETAAKRMLFIGLGPSQDFDIHGLRKVAGQLAQIADGMKVRSVGFLLPAAGYREGDAVAAAAEGWVLGSWRFTGYHQKPAERQVPSFIMAGVTGAEAAQEGLKRGLVIGQAQNLTRELGFMPSNKLYPELLAAQAVQAGKAHGFEVEVLDEARLAELGMGALLGVGQGSVHPPRLVIMRYQGRSDKTLALVGKGITFDSGGISLKPPAGMEEMKYDMLGAGAVLGAMCAIADTKPAVNVTGVMAIAQNMPSGSSYKPGDVVQAFNGKTIEVTNTDAEGRVVLADGVSYAAHLRPDWIVETSTLTGAVLVVLGHEASGLVASNDSLAERVTDAANAAGERVWRLPIYPEYKALYKSAVADIKNSPGRDAGTITGGMIIGEFAGDVPFAHLDIAGTAWTKEGPLNAVSGPTGVMVRTFVELAHALA